MGREAVFVFNPVINLTMIILHVEGGPGMCIHFTYNDSTRMPTVNELSRREESNFLFDTLRHRVNLSCNDRPS